ncbi:MAG: tRNA (N6-isopentenyl adenosine(37)-C2)-methylthiotransferase MiaB [Pseudomonadota bacterium]
MASAPPGSQAPRRVFIKTFGCQMNVYDSGKLLALLRLDGFAPTDDWREADLVIVNTCSVRAKPQLKVRSFLGPIIASRRARGGPRIAIAGCVAQHEGAELFRRMPEVDLVMGTDALTRVRALVRESEHRRVLDNSFLEVADYPFVQELSPPGEPGVTALVTIQKGCDNHCTYCIVPQTRGTEISRPVEEILEEVRGLCAHGARDVTLIGQNVNAYGKKQAGYPGFASLLRAVHALPEVWRLRYTTSHPRDMDADTIACHAELPRLADHLHLPVQAGSDRVLRRMGRGYDRARYLEVVRALKAANPRLSLSTDIIVGFPGETREDFEATLSLMEEVHFDASFSFVYSPRPDTAAVRLYARQPVPAREAGQRLMELQALQSRLQLEGNQALVGQEREVLVEGPSRHDPAQQVGRTSCFRAVNFPGGPELVGRLVPVRITAARAHSLVGIRAGGTPPCG